MRRSLAGFSLLFFLAIFASGCGSGSRVVQAAQTPAPAPPTPAPSPSQPPPSQPPPSQPPSTNPPAAAATGANVYVQSDAGVYVYHADASGQLTLLQGSPFPVTGYVQAVRGQDLLLSVDTHDVYAYQVGSDGAVGSLLSQTDAWNYAGGECGPTVVGAILDHTGQYFSVQAGAQPKCSAWQTYKVASNGQLTFLGDDVSTEGYRGAAPIFLYTYGSGDNFAYGLYTDPYADSFRAYRRNDSGVLVKDSEFNRTGPTPNPSLAGGDYMPLDMAADPSNHLAALMNTPFNSNTAVQLASFTIDPSTGAIQSTNTWQNMPVLQIHPNGMQTSWTGSYVAVAGIPGLQVFHFNGAAPPTAFGDVMLSNVEIDEVAWDKGDHLYALSFDIGNPNSTGDLYVFTVTRSGITPAPGSPYAIHGTNTVNGRALVVVPTS